MHKYNLPYEEALARAKKGRIVCQPNTNFAKQLKDFEKKKQQQMKPWRNVCMDFIQYLRLYSFFLSFLPAILPSMMLPQLPFWMNQVICFPSPAIFA